RRVVGLPCNADRHRVIVDRGVVRRDGHSDTVALARWDDDVAGANGAAHAHRYLAEHRHLLVRRTLADGRASGNDPWRRRDHENVICAVGFASKLAREHSDDVPRLHGRFPFAANEPLRVVGAGGLVSDATSAAALYGPDVVRSGEKGE